MHVSKAALALCILVLAAPPALAQSSDSNKTIDLKPLLPPIIPPPLLPPHSTLTPDTLTGAPSTTYSGPPLYGSSQSQPVPGLKLTIPTR